MSAPTEPVVLCASVALSYIAYWSTKTLLLHVTQDFINKGLKGVDMLKGYEREPDSLSPKGTTMNRGRVLGPELPEATGVVGAAVYILLLCFFAPLPYWPHFWNPPAFISTILSVKPVLEADAGVAFPHHSLSTYLASLFSLLIATFLGFLDDVFDIRWRYKLPIPVIASVPLLVVYFAGQGLTDVVLPKIFGLRKLFGVENFGGLVHLGPLYYLYMSMLSTFCTNSINILAGVNGVEVGQSLVIAISIALNDLLYLTIDLSPVVGREFHLTTGLAKGSPELSDRHLFSLYFMLPLIGVCFGLLSHNWYPARAFIGDTFCYFAGMAFAVVGILGHFSKTLLLFFIPQIFNFVFSTPQLFGLVPCPRHRLPRYESSTGLLHPSTTTCTKPPNTLTVLILKTFSALRLVKLTYSRDGKIISSTNLTLLCAILVVVGPMPEPTLTKYVMGCQAVGTALAFVIRYGAAGFFYDIASRR